MKKNLKISHWLAVSNNNEILVNLVYSKIGKKMVGTFFGYEGGGMFSDGFFVIDKNFDIKIETYLEDFDEETAKALETLLVFRGQFENKEDEDNFGAISNSALKLQDDEEAEVFEDHWMILKNVNEDDSEYFLLLQENWALHHRLVVE